MNIIIIIIISHIHVDSITIIVTTLGLRQPLTLEAEVLYVNSIPHGHALFRRIMVQSCDTWYAMRTVEHVMYNTCDHFGLECE